MVGKIVLNIWGLINTLMFALCKPFSSHESTESNKQKICRDNLTYCRSKLIISVHSSYKHSDKIRSKGFSLLENTRAIFLYINAPAQDKRMSH